MAFKSILKPENSMLAGVGVMGTVFATYQLNIGTTAQAAATDSNHPVLESSRKKAGYESLILVAGIGLIAKDANIMILGFATIIAMEVTFRHAIMADPSTGQMVAPSPGVYQPAESNVTPMYQGETA